MLSAFAAAPFFISTVNFVYLRRLDLFAFLRRLPLLCLGEVKYLVTGIEECPPVQGNPPSSASPTPIFSGIQESFVTSPNISLPPIDLPTHSPRGSLLEDPQQPRGLWAGHRQGGVPWERVRLPTPLVAGVPVAVIYDIIPMLLRKKATIESVELIRAFYQQR